MRQAALAAVLVLVACSGGGGGAGGSPAVGATTPAPAASPSATPCGATPLSYRPEGPLPAPGAFSPGSLMATIHDRGRLVAGVAQDEFMFGFIDTGRAELQGFDIDMVKQVSLAIFGDENHVEYHAITDDQRKPLVENGTVDIVAKTMTINCERWQQVAFSTVYYDAGQRVLVPASSSAQRIEDLAGKTICATAGSTSLENIRQLASRSKATSVALWTDCLELMQLGQVDAISTDDTILNGLVAQDPSVKVVGPKLTDEPYGLAMSLRHPEFVRFVNAVLERMRQDGTWARLYERWLSRLGPTPAPPAAAYRD
jgi:polar amino acid transport system substrate-binding protein